MKKKLKIVFGFVLVFLFVEIQAQTIKVKKEKVLWDKIPIALLKNPYTDHYEFSNLEGEKVFTVDMKGASNGKIEIYHFLQLESASETKTAQIKYEEPVTLLTKEIRKGAFDLKEEENLYTIIEEYENCN